MKEAPHVLREALINRTFVAQENKGPIEKGNTYRISIYQLFDSKTSCELCHRPRQTERLAHLSNAERPGIIKTGLDCLTQVSGISKSVIEGTAAKQIGIAGQTKALLRRGLSHSGATGAFENIDEIFENLIELTRSLSNSPYNSVVEAELSKIRQALATQELDSSMNTKIQDLLTYLNFRQYTEQFSEDYKDRVQALINDPHKEASKFVELLASLPLTEPALLSIQDVITLRKSMRGVASLSLPARRNPAIDPADFTSQSEYQEALKNYYEAKAEAGEEQQSHLQVTYDSIYFGHRTPDSRDMLGGMQVPCVTGIYSSNVTEDIRFLTESTIRFLQARHGNKLQIYRAINRQYLDVRTDPPKKREERNRDRNAVQLVAENTQPVECWMLACWVPDTWHDVFLIWRKFGGRAEALRFPDAQERQKLQPRPES